MIPLTRAPILSLLAGLLAAMADDETLAEALEKFRAGDSGSTILFLRAGLAGRRSRAPGRRDAATMTSRSLPPRAFRPRRSAPATEALRARRALERICGLLGHAPRAACRLRAAEPRSRCREGRGREATGGEPSKSED